MGGPPCRILDTVLHPSSSESHSVHDNEFPAEQRHRPSDPPATNLRRHERVGPIVIDAAPASTFTTTRGANISRARGLWSVAVASARSAWLKLPRGRCRSYPTITSSRTRLMSPRRFWPRNWSHSRRRARACLLHQFGRRSQRHCRQIRLVLQQRARPSEKKKFISARAPITALRSRPAA